MDDVQIILSELWVAYLLGDFLRIIADAFKAGEIEGKKNESENASGG